MKNGCLNQVRNCRFRHPFCVENEPDNRADKEAIKVTMKGSGKVGYVANNTATVLGESMSAGRLYDKIVDKAYGKVLYVLPQGVVCELMQTGCVLRSDVIVE